MIGYVLVMVEECGFFVFVLDVLIGQEFYVVDVDVVWFLVLFIKMMMLYMLFEVVGSGKYSLFLFLKVLGNVVCQFLVKIGFKVGMIIMVEQVVWVLVVKLVNDVGVVVVENFVGSEVVFVWQMICKVWVLGLK